MQPTSANWMHPICADIGGKHLSETVPKLTREHPLILCTLLRSIDSTLNVLTSTNVIFLFIDGSNCRHAFYSLVFSWFPLLIASNVYIQLQCLFTFVLENPHNGFIPITVFLYSLWDCYYFFNRVCNLNSDFYSWVMKKTQGKLK